MVNKENIFPKNKCHYTDVTRRKHF